MVGVLAPPAAHVPDALDSDLAGAVDARRRNPEDTALIVNDIVKRRREFGITRVGSVTRLDRVGIPVVQVARPLALSNAVTQGKGLSLIDAAASALMEAIETWSAERIPPERIRTSKASALGADTCSLYAGSVDHDAPTDWQELDRTWIEGWDLLAGRTRPVPLALVDTVYTYPSPHPFVFPRNTTGLGAGPTMLHAIMHAGLEILERDARAQANRTPHFFDRCQVDSTTVRGGRASRLLRHIVDADLLVGIWQVPASHELPIYWCHVMEAEGHNELVPLPAAGFGCAFTHDGALTKALLEACQARLTAISGAREDVTRRSYPQDYDREHLAEWRRQLAEPVNAGDFAWDDRRQRRAAVLDDLLAALGAAGAQAVLAVPLFADTEASLHVVRVVAPPLRYAGEG